MRVVGEIVEDCENASRGHLVDDTLAARATRPGCAIKISVGRLNDCAHGIFSVSVGEAVKDGELASGSDFEDSAIHVRECSAQIGSIKIAVVAERDRLRIADVAVEREQDFIDSRGRHLIYGAGDRAPVSGGAVEVPVLALDRWSIGGCSFGIAVEVVHHGDGPGGGDLEEGSVSDWAAGGSRSVQVAVGAERQAAIRKSRR